MTTEDAHNLGRRIGHRLVPLTVALVLVGAGWVLWWLVAH